MPFTTLLDDSNFQHSFDMTFSKNASHWNLLTAPAHALTSEFLGTKGSTGRPLTPDNNQTIGLVHTAGKPT